ncbi:MAG: hypothetical protein E6Q50_01995 [Lysobacter sp.]|nr:MAG: hypothetical protein E6Q50_01995 [Lysobacter sp.]
MGEAGERARRRRVPIRAIEGAANDSVYSKRFFADPYRLVSWRDDVRFICLVTSTFGNGEPLNTSKTQRAADRMSVVFRFATDGESKNPDSVREPGAICRGKVLSFAYFSLHEQRKVGRAPARKPLPASPKKIETLSTQNFRCIHHPDVER